LLQNEKKKAIIEQTAETGAEIPLSIFKEPCKIKNRERLMNIRAILPTKYENREKLTIADREAWQDRFDDVHPELLEKIPQQQGVQ
jgi:hypothetical protein